MIKLLGYLVDTPAPTCPCVLAMIAMPYSLLLMPLLTMHHDNVNLTCKKELFHWRCHLGYMGLHVVQFLMCTGVLATSEAQHHLHAAACHKTSYPVCTACQFGKQKHWPLPGKHFTMVKGHDGSLQKHKLLSGQSISVDHFICSTKGHSSPHMGNPLTS